MCVDFYVNVSTENASALLARVNRTTTDGARPVVPYLIEYYGGCTSGTKVNPASEKLAESNAYSSFEFADISPEEFSTPVLAKPCATSRSGVGHGRSGVGHGNGGNGGGNVRLMTMFGHVAAVPLL